MTGQPVTELARAVRERLLPVMCRTERPDTASADMLAEQLSPAAPIGEDDLLGYVALRELASAIDSQMSVDYWKSAPYFVNFSDGYQFATRLQAALSEPERCAALRPLLRRTQHLDAGAIRRYEPLDYGNPRLRRLAADTVDAGWWQLLWLPSSLPYLTPGGPYAQTFAANVTKRLVFSSWTATPMPSRPCSATKPNGESPKALGSLRTPRRRGARSPTALPTPWMANVRRR